MMLADSCAAKLAAVEWPGNSIQSDKDGEYCTSSRRRTVQASSSMPPRRWPARSRQLCRSSEVRQATACAHECEDFTSKRAAPAAHFFACLCAHATPGRRHSACCGPMLCATHLVHRHVTIGRDRAAVLLTGQQQLQRGLERAEHNNVLPCIECRPRHRCTESAHPVQRGVLPQRHQRRVEVNVCEGPGGGAARLRVRQPAGSSLAAAGRRA